MHKLLTTWAAVLSFAVTTAAVAAQGTTLDDVAADGAPLPLGTSTSPINTASGTTLICNWRPANGTPTASTPPGSMRWGYIDLAAGYWQLILSPFFPAGTTFKLEGQYPSARNFSFQLYDGAGVGLASLTDYELQPDSGSQSPFDVVNDLDTAIQPGGHYTVYLVYGAAPAQPAPNTIYIDASKFSAGSQAVLIYRVYNSFGSGSIVNYGDEPLPAAYEVTTKGTVPLSALDNTLACNSGIGLRDGMRRVRASLVDQIFAKPLAPQAIAAKPVPAAPVFQLRDNPSDVLANSDTRYIYVTLSQTKGDLVLMRARAPTYATGPNAGSDPQLRHWSVCENALWTVETYACIEDSDAAIDGDGFFNIVISVPTKKPANATHAYSFDWLPFGTCLAGTPIFRHMLASPNFTQSAFQMPTGKASEAPQIMGDYFPQATYCASSVFAAHTGNKETPAQVFAACAAGQ
ncbi:MAG: hypothetical protein P4L83_15730 [Nevskia sp.]|nr:hypothetical protein [Nevskia sp.]